ncbi:hypothetical protein [Streptomyces bambusae]|uniref:Sensor histidine kinase n=1 Tax=Streptomyces bambusae TaxID=1550616 RepID=A0ABS6YZC6_9ACTN|nr:hypothetical protein [Streptomyces bambusae]MBW5480835.1 hypothetical protein [Streptomyces bambusae]
MDGLPQARLRERDPWSWRQQLAVLLYVAAVSVLVVALAVAGDPGR